MKLSPNLLVVLVVALFANVQCELTLLGETLTPFGEWQDWDLCPEGTFVTGADVRTKRIMKTRRSSQSSGTHYDDVGLVSVVLQCDSPPGTPDPVREFIFSRVRGIENDVPGGSARPEAGGGKNGTNKLPEPVHIIIEHSDEARNEQISYSLPLRNMCEGVATGYQMMVQPEQVAVDNAGATNMRLYCSELKQHATNQFIEAYGQTKGEWTDEQLCRSRQAICGIQTISETLDEAGDFDNTGINNLRLKCCDLPNPASTCEPSDEWQLIQECDGRYSDGKLSCSYTRHVGLSTTKSEDYTAEYDFNESNGYSLESEDPFWVQNGLAENFHRFNHSAKTGFTWSKASDETFGDGAPELVEFQLETQMMAKIYQTVGKCSYLVARAPRFKIETQRDTLDGELTKPETKMIDG